MNMPWMQVNIAIALLLIGYRIRLFRKNKKSIWLALGLSWDRNISWRHLATGTAISTFAISSVFVFEWLTGHLQIVGISAPTALINDFSTFIAVPLIEEFIFRCALLGGLLVLIPRTSIAVLISAFIFGGLHALNQNATSFSIFITSIGGLAYGIGFLISERIWFPLGLHFGWNYFQARIFGFSISGGFHGPAPLILQHDNGPAILTGGVYGPEGGLVGLGAKLIVLTLVAAYFVFRRQRSAKTSDYSPHGSLAAVNHIKRSGASGQN
jgi:membrane protease YdiL (CAAX protease family)